MWYPREEGLQNMPRLAEKLGDLGTIFIFLFMTMLDLCCCSNFSLVVASGGYSLVAVRGFSLGWLLLWSMDSRVCWLQRLWIPGPRAQAQLLWCMALVGASLVAQMVKNLPAMREGLIPGLGRSPLEGNGYPLQYCCLENPMDRVGWQQQSMGSQRVGHHWATNLLGYSCSPVHGIFLDQGLNPHLLHWQVDSLPMSHQGSPRDHL